MLFSTPEYAGALPGSFENLLDWCADIRITPAAIDDDGRVAGAAIRDHVPKVLATLADHAA